MLDNSIVRSPGIDSKVLGFVTKFSGVLLLGNEIYIVEGGVLVHDSQIIITPRIGADDAGEDARLPYRFFVKNSVYVSGSKLQNKSNET
jgi:DNA-3-methyladenine glycosylase